MNAEIFNLSNLQKIIFAKNLLEGSAKLFVEYESSATDWEMLKNELRKEYEKSTNSLIIHQQLAQRYKRRDKTAIQYLYEMLNIGQQGNVEIRAVLTHCTNGLPGSPQSKAILYEANTLHEYKQKLQAHELQQNQSHGHSKKNYDKSKSTETPKADIRRCNNCGVH